jgi:tetratricopeptide (TPR) repeat protein
LAFRGFNKPQKTLNQQQASEKFKADFATIISNAQKKLPDIDRAFMKEQAQIANESDTTIAFRAGRVLVRYWDSLERFDISGYYYSKIYERSHAEADLMAATHRYYEYSTFSGDSAAVVYFRNRAAEGFNKVLEMNPQNLDAKVGKAMCIVADRGRVMEVVPLLKEVLRADSNHILANYTLGRLQIESGQLEKALLSFEKLVSLQPFNGDFYVYLADVQKKMGNNNDAIKNYEKAKILMLDEENKHHIDDIINGLKSK